MSATSILGPGLPFNANLIKPSLGHTGVTLRYHGSNGKREFRKATAQAQPCPVQYSRQAASRGPLCVDWKEWLLCRDDLL